MKARLSGVGLSVLGWEASRQGSQWPLEQSFQPKSTQRRILLDVLGVEWLPSPQGSEVWGKSCLFLSPAGESHGATGLDRNCFLPPFSHLLPPSSLPRCGGGGAQLWGSHVPSRTWLYLPDHPPQCLLPTGEVRLWGSKANTPVFQMRKQAEGWSGGAQDPQPMS